VAILLSVVFFEVFFLAPRDITNKKSPLSESEKDGKKEKKNASQVISKIELVESNEKGKEWELKADEASLFEVDQLWQLRTVGIQLYGEAGATYHVTGDTGTVAIDTKDILIEGNVKIVSSSGYQFSTASARYVSETRELLAPNEVVMEGPPEEKDRRLNLTGMGLLAKMDDNNIYVLRDVRATKGIESNETVSIQSGSAEFSGKNHTARFIRDVIVDMGGTRITGPQAEFYYDNKSSEVKSMSVLGGIKISDIDKWAAADRIDMYFEEKKFVLSGSPRVIQNNDELVGEEIIFHNGGEDIEVKGAKARFSSEN
jgi:LPS export ABC transporter protein LptC/lipopolysaccharide transport protein LptA